MTSTRELQNRALVLVVDDDPELRATTAQLLSQEFEVLTAQNGLEALELIALREIDVVCTDYNMPGLDGIELLRRVAASYPPIESILITGFREYAQRQMGSDDTFLLVVKPYNPETLIKIIRRAVRSAQANRTFAPLAKVVG